MRVMTVDEDKEFVLNNAENAKILHWNVRTIRDQRKNQHGEIKPDKENRPSHCFAHQ